MINTLSFLSLLCHLWFQQPNHQKNKHLPETEKQWFDLQKRHKDYYDDCIFTNRYSVQQSLRKYPFIKASAIIAVSYHAEEPPNPTYFDNNGHPINPGSDTLRIPAGLHIKNGRIDTKTLAEFVALKTSRLML